MTSTSVRLSWLAGSNGGENATYTISINGLYNLTTYTDTVVSEVDSDPESIENRFNLVEIRGLESARTYEFKILAFNGLGASDFSPSVRVTTPTTSLESDRLPRVLNAHFNEVHEAICFELSESVQNMHAENFVLKVDVALNDELVHAAQDLIRLNNRSSSSSLFSQQRSALNSLKQFRSTLETLSNQPVKSKTYLIDLSNAHSCVLYSQLVSLDYQLRANSTLFSGKKLSSDKSRLIPVVYSLNAIMSNSATTDSPLPIVSSIYSKYNTNNAKLESLVRNFFEFKKFHRVNVTLCYKKDSSVCAEKISVYDYQTDFSSYITVVAIGCSAVLIFIILLMVSLCCCCCRRRARKNQQLKRKAELTIKSFPIVTQNSSKWP